MSNLAGLCATHHGVIHRHHWALDLQPDGTLVFTRPDATVLTSPPPRLRRRPALPLHHPHTRNLIPAFPDPPTPSTRSSDPQHSHTDPTGIEPAEIESTRIEFTDLATTGMVRTRAVDLVRRQRRGAPPMPDLLEWLEAG